MIDFEDLSKIEHNKTLTTIVSILESRIHSNAVDLFRVNAVYHLAKIAAGMRAKVRTKDRGDIPVNVYAICLAVSGIGKGYSCGILESEISKSFNEAFSKVFQESARQSIVHHARDLAFLKDVSEEAAHDKLSEEFSRTGEYLSSFDSATTPAIKQMRHKLLLARAGSLNLEIDEIGDNLIASGEALSSYLELFDVGLIKEKLIKNTNTETRLTQLRGKTPANLLLMGTPSKLFDGSIVEENYWSIIEAGLARRCVFAYYPELEITTNDLSIEDQAIQIYENMKNSNTNDDLIKVDKKLASLANLNNFNKVIKMEKEATILLITYQLHCNKLTHNLGEFDVLRKYETKHRPDRVIKIAGVFGFIDGKKSIDKEYLLQAIKFVEESGKSFKHMLKKQNNYEKLAKYIASVPFKLTQIDLMENLSFFKGSIQKKKELIQLAIAWGYPNNIVITQTYVNGVDFLEGKQLEKTTNTNIILSHSPNLSSNYIPQKAKLESMDRLLLKDNYNWAVHEFKGQHRLGDNVIEGFNLAVFDVDEGKYLKTCLELLVDNCYIIHTTKRHTLEKNKFRLILPLSHIILLDASNYTEFMKNIEDWLPISTDTQTFENARKWNTYNGHYYTNLDKPYLDVYKFIPYTSQNLQHKNFILELEDMDGLDRWFLNTISNSGNRNNKLLRYAHMISDKYGLKETTEKLIRLNNKLTDKLSKEELDKTILTTIAKKLEKK